MRREVSQQIDRSFEIVVVDRRQLLHFLLQFQALLEKLVLIGDEAVVPAHVHASDFGPDFIESLVQILRTENVANRLGNGLSPVFWWLEAHKDVQYLLV